MFRRSRFLRPFSRSAMLLLAWQNRRTLSMWARSIRDEANWERASGRPDFARWKALAPALWRHRDAAERGAVTSLLVTDDHRVIPHDASAAAARAASTASTFSGVDAPRASDIPTPVA